MKSYLTILMCLITLTKMYCYNRKRSTKLRTSGETEFETSSQIKKLKKMVISLKNELINNIKCNNNTINLSNKTNSNPNTTKDNITNETKITNKTIVKDKSNKTIIITGKKNCKCKNKMTSMHITALNNIVYSSNFLKTDHPLLYDSLMKKKTFKQKKLSKYFVKKLLKKLEIDQETIDKCLKAPLSSFAKILTLSHEIVNGKKGFGELSVLSNWLCDDLRIIPEKLNDSTIFNDVRNYMNSHIKNY